MYMLHTEYYKDGTPCECSEMRRWYYSVGTLEYEVPYVDGEKHGITKVYYEAGALKCVMLYVNGKPNGIQKEYHETGVLFHEAVWKNGALLKHSPVENFLYK